MICIGSWSVVWKSAHIAEYKAVNYKKLRFWEDPVSVFGNSIAWDIVANKCSSLKIFCL